MKEYIDMITQLSEKLHAECSGLHNIDMAQCDNWQDIVDELSALLEDIRCYIYAHSPDKCCMKCKYFCPGRIPDIGICDLCGSAVSESFSHCTAYRPRN